MEALWAPALHGRLTCEAYIHSTEGVGGSRMILRLDGEAFWDHPTMFFDHLDLPTRWTPIQKNYGSWYYPIPLGLIEAYMNTPVVELMEPIHGDDYDLCDILRAADRRIGFKRLMWWAMFEMPAGSLAKKVLAVRFNKAL
ncbi:MAG: hypothetical protein EOP83_12260 [Verrucomicrobiaceae bacterium]|nr:MAG: hypothetical protein EOP83_12260 [Verrucomicrobiaceae bacterium]